MANKQFSINDIINEQAQGLDVENENENENENTATLVRYEGGETAKDREGNTFTTITPKDKFNKLLGSNTSTPITAKVNEPEYGDEWANDAAQKVWDSGKSMDEVEKEMGKQWPLANAIIKDNEIEAMRAGDPDKGPDVYGKNVPYYEKMDDGNGGYYYKSPREQAEDVLADRYGFIKNSFTKLQPSIAIGLLNKTKLKKDWENWITAKGIYSSSRLDTEYATLRDKLSSLDNFKTEAELKKLGFSSQEDYSRIVSYLIRCLSETYKRRKANKKAYEESTAFQAAQKAPVDQLKVAQKAPADKPQAPKTEAAQKAPVDQLKVAQKAPADKPQAPKTEAAQKETTDKIEAAMTSGKTAPVEETKAEEVAQNEIADVDAPTETEETPASVEEPTFVAEQARLNSEMAEQEKQAQEEAEAIANKELTREEAEDIDRKLEEAARKRQQDLFDYEDWLKNPSLISGIFGKSGLSTARRVGLGLAALFAIFSDVASSYGKGINNNTDFKTTAMDQLNSTITAIQNKRADTIGDMAARPYSTATDNEEKLNKDYEKLRRLPAGTYIPKPTLQAFIQESQIDTNEPMSESLYERFNNDSRDGFIDSIKKNKALRNAYLNEDGTLNADGELKFLNKQEQSIAQYKNVLGLSDERLSNINNLLEMDKKRAEVRSKVHDVIFQTNADYINAINAMESENRALEESKLGFTEVKTLDAMLDLAQKNRSVISGLATSSANTTEGESDTESSLHRFQEQGGLEKVNEELKKHGWQAELNGEVGAQFPIKVIPLSAKITGGGKWTNEQANKHLQSEYDKWTRDDQRSLTKVRNLSAASGKTIDESYDEIINFLNSEKAKGAAADFNEVRQNVIDSINNKIQYNNQVIDELKKMREREGKFDTGENSSVSTRSPYVSMFNDVPTKDSNWYKHRLAVS